ncbi:MAG TPA: SGNH/GDSL hydrolase family protein [Vicinamibacterales bacterium]|nr:SGNH/GDSL hydrolase family protein [Vicinamibacterales bacterium]
MGPRAIAIGVLAAALAAACGSDPGPVGPTPTVPRLSRTRFLAFGDSITAGEVTQPLSGHAGVTKLLIVPAASYPAVLQSRLAATYTAQTITVINAGESNETILEGVRRFDEIFPASQAQVVLLQEGVNHLNLIGPDISTGLMRMMVHRAKDGQARVFVASMIPTVPGRPRAGVSPAALVAYNSVLQIMCTQEGITYVDLYNAMLSEAETLIGSDGLHPTEAGYRRIAELFFEVIRRELTES